MNYTLMIVALGTGFLGFLSGTVGSFAILKKQGLLGDAISHASLPGIALAFLLLQYKSTAVFMIGALIAGLLATWLIMKIESLTRIKIDSAMALILSSFFGLGMVLLTYIQKVPNSNQAGLEKFIFGQASTMLRSDVYLIIGSALVMLLLVVVFWKEIKVVVFDEQFADTMGIDSRRIRVLLSFMTVVTIIIGLQAVGVILMSALLVAPAVAARQWTDRLSLMVILAGIFGSVSGVVGTVVSSSVGKMPTGPAIVICISVFVMLSLFLAPKRGILWNKLKMMRNRAFINDEQVLFNLYALAMNHEDTYHAHDEATIKPVKTQAGKKVEKLRHSLKDLEKRELVASYAKGWAITEKGMDYVRNHQLGKEYAYERQY